MLLGPCRGKRSQNAKRLIDHAQAIRAKRLGELEALRKPSGASSASAQAAPPSAVGPGDPPEAPCARSRHNHLNTILAIALEATSGNSLPTKARLLHIFATLCVFSLQKLANGACAGPQLQLQLAARVAAGKVHLRGYARAYPDLRTLHCLCRMMTGSSGDLPSCRTLQAWLSEVDAAGSFAEWCLPRPAPLRIRRHHIDTCPELRAIINRVATSTITQRGTITKRSG